jgi:hypothetical protein
MKAYEFDWQPFFGQLLTGTIVELQNPKDQAALGKKLRAAGIFIQARGKAVQADTPRLDLT